MISIDTETTGIDHHHGCAPFLVTSCDSEGEVTWWEWHVDPLTRKPDIPEKDLEDIQQLIDQAESLVLQNSKFDVMALQVAFRGKLRWDWGKTHDTLLAGHLLASGEPHDLTSMSRKYLNHDIGEFDEVMRQACVEARRLARSQYPDWRIAQKGMPELPSAREKVAKNDMWLPRAVARKERYRADHPWRTLCREYANADSEATLYLFKRQEQLLWERDLWLIYRERLKLLPIVYDMESRGVTLSRDRLESLREEYTEESGRSGRVCVRVAESLGHALTLPKAGVNGSLVDFCESPVGMDLVPLASTGSSFDTGKGNSSKVSVANRFIGKSGRISLSRAAVDHYRDQLERVEPRGKRLTFLDSLLRKRKRDTALNYMAGYERFWVPAEDPGWYRLHPSLNPTGTGTLRWSSSNPNEQNISKQEGFNLRFCFGPAPGREWWSLDAKNIELRLPAYESGETEMVELFEKEDQPPYFGSYHMLIFDTLHPEKFAKHGMDSKKVYGSSWYQWTKNGNFAVQYGAVESSGTADRAYHIPGAQKRIQKRFSKVFELNRKMIALATRDGYVETMPDSTVDPERGYPLQCPRSHWGDILPTVPLNYHVQGTAMWWMMKAMIRCYKYLSDLPGYYLMMQIHDELVFDFPAGSGREPWRTNLPKIRKVRRLMEQGGEDLGVPTPVSVEYHSNNWSEGEGL